jgi:hypothetical protein
MPSESRFRLAPVRTGSELLALTPPAPLSARVLARPLRVCVFAPAVDGVAWERLVEHALATQMRFWGGASNLVVPTGRNLADDELFLRLVECFDPDVIAWHSPTFGDVEGIAPESYAAGIADADRKLAELNFDQATRDREIARLREEPFWQMSAFSEDFRRKLMERAAPLHLGEAEPQEVYIDGTAAPSYPLTDVAAFRELPGSVLDITTTLGDTDQLLLTHAVGRILPEFRSALEARGVAINAVSIEHQANLLGHVMPRGRVVADFTYPRFLPLTGLSRRLSVFERGGVVVVVGGEPEDFLLFHGLSRLRPYVYWLPAAHLESQAFLYELAAAARRSAQEAIGGGNVIAVTSTASEDAATTAVAALNDVPGRAAPQASLADWRELIPVASFPDADARSERRVSLLRHEGETQELPTPLPVSVSTEEPSVLRWMVDVEVDGWTPARHASLGTAVFVGPLVTEHDVRTTSVGPSYFGLSPFTQPALGLEASTARPRLRPRSIVEQVGDIVRPLGWDVSLSDKGAFALQSARLLGGIDVLATSLRSQATRALLDAYLTPTTTNDPGIFLMDTRRRYLSLDEAGNTSGAGDIATLVAQLYDHGALVRGHILKCEHCRSTSFYSLSDEQEFTCVRCRTRQRATRFSWLGAPEPEFRYALSEVLFQFLRNNGQLPLLAAHDVFVKDRSRERRVFDMAFEVELTTPEGELEEHDIIATWGAELWVGEATGADKLARTNAAEVTRLRKLKEVAHVLSARGVLFVTTAETFRTRTKESVSRVFSDPGWPRVVYREGFDDGPNVDE